MSVIIKKQNNTRLKPYTFTEHEITDEKNWKKERRDSWKKASLQSQSDILAKHSPKYIRSTSPDALCDGLNKKISIY